jgi:hypothetical protein
VAFTVKLIGSDSKPIGKDHVSDNLAFLLAFLMTAWSRKTTKKLFLCPFEFQIMPFELAIAPATFQKLMYQGFKQAQMDGMSRLSR